MQLKTEHGYLEFRKIITVLALLSKREKLKTPLEKRHFFCFFSLGEQRKESRKLNFPFLK